MTIERWTITTREEWLERRKPNINGSEVGALFGCSPFLTPFALFADKAGLAALPELDSDVLERGQILEPSIPPAVLKDRPDWKIEKATDYLWSPQWRLGCTPDFDVYCPRRGKGVLQGKTVAGREFDEKWQDGPPDWILLQTQLEAMLTERSWAAIGVLIIRNAYKLERKVYEFDQHDGSAARIIAEAARFWADVDADRMPAPNYAVDGDTIKALYPRDSGEIVDLSRHNRINMLCEEKLAWATRHATAEKALDVINAEITDILRDADRGDHPLFNITRKEQWVGGGVPTPRKKIRVLRVTRRKVADAEQEQAA